MKYELDLYDKWCEGKEEGIKEGRKEGLSEGIQKGRDEGILRTAAAAGEGASGTAGAARLPAGRQAVPAVDAVRALLRRAHAPKTRAFNASGIIAGNVIEWAHENRGFLQKSGR